MGGDCAREWIGDGLRSVHVGRLDGELESV